jgi:putative peptidoglycan lipid II flippase
VDSALYFANLRILLVAQFFFVVGGVFTGTFNSMRLFWWPALQPVFFNVGIIIAGFIGHKMGYGVISQAWGALGGAIVGSILVQVPVALRAGLSIAPLWDVRDEGVQKVLAAGEEGGGATTISNASRLMILPLELLASGSAIAIFPTLSALAAKGETAEVGRQLSALLRRTLKLLCIAVVGLWIVAVPLLLGLVKGGQFSGADSVWTGKVLLISALSLPGLGAQQLIARGFYALGDNATPVKAGVGVMLLFAVLALLSNALNWGTLGVTGASVVAVSVLGAVLWKQLQKKLGNL